MVIGNGLIATAFTTYSNEDSFLIFASGVSDSGNTAATAFERERSLLEQSLRDSPARLVVYFSTCSIYDPSLHQSPYVLHKMAMEELVKVHPGGYTIFRVSNPIGVSRNPHTVLNFFIHHLLHQRPFDVWQYASRNLLDIKDMFLICDYILQNRLFVNETVNVANPVNYPVSYIIEALEKHFQLHGKYALVEKGNSPLIDTTAIQPFFSQLHIHFDSNYLTNLLRKYFPLV